MLVNLKRTDPKLLLNLLRQVHVNRTSQIKRLIQLRLPLRLRSHNRLFSRGLRISNTVHRRIVRNVNLTTVVIYNAVVPRFRNLLYIRTSQSNVAVLLKLADQRICPTRSKNLGQRLFALGRSNALNRKRVLYVQVYRGRIRARGRRRKHVVRRVAVHNSWITSASLNDRVLKRTVRSHTLNGHLRSVRHGVDRVRASQVAKHTRYLLNRITTVQQRTNPFRRHLTRYDATVRLLNHRNLSVRVAVGLQTIDHALRHPSTTRYRTTNNPAHYRGVHRSVKHPAVRIPNTLRR